MIEIIMYLPCFTANMLPKVIDNMPTRPSYPCCRYMQGEKKVDPKWLKLGIYLIGNAVCL